MADADSRIRTWKLEDAKAKLSEVVRRAQSEGPQLLTVRGQPAVHVVPVGTDPFAGIDFNVDLVTFFQNSPFRDLPEDIDFDIPTYSPIREIEL